MIDTEGWQLTGKLRWLEAYGVPLVLQQEWSRPRRNWQYGEPGLDYEWRDVPVEREL
jgi:hypothetical protein